MIFNDIIGLQLLPGRLRRAVLTTFLCSMASLMAAGCAQLPAENYQPRVGQEGKDVIWVPSPPAVVERMLEIAEVTRSDFVMDLGSGDGRNIIAAGRRGARGIGVEFNPDMVALSNRAAEKEGVASRVSFVQGDMFAADISQANVLALFLLPDNLRRLLPKFLDLRPGSRIVVNYFGIEGWTPDVEEEMKEGCQPWCLIKLYVVPAKADGAWRSAGMHFVFEQRFQMIGGSVTEGGVNRDISEGRLAGDRIRFKAGDAEYTGQVFGNRIEGERKSGGVTAAWVVTR
jgi:SAM-dependent methyltransferase